MHFSVRMTPHLWWFLNYCVECSLHLKHFWNLLKCCIHRNYFTATIATSAVLSVFTKGMPSELPSLTCVIVVWFVVENFFFPDHTGTWSGRNVNSPPRLTSLMHASHMWNAIKVDSSARIASLKAVELCDLLCHHYPVPLSHVVENFPDAYRVLISYGWWDSGTLEEIFWFVGCCHIGHVIDDDLVLVCCVCVVFSLQCSSALLALGKQWSLLAE